MIYLLHGENFVKLRSKLRDIINSVVKKNPEAAYFRITPDNLDKEKLEELLGAQGLFQSKYVTALDGFFSSKSAADLLEKLESLSLSPNIFIVVEDALTKEVIKKISKYAEKVQDFSSAQKKKKVGEDFNVFNLTDAFGARDKKRLWVLYQRALRSGMEPEEIHRLIFWQVKAMITARNSKSAGDAGLNPFVFRKSVGFSRNFSKEELNSLSSQLIRLYHDARRGILDFNNALERFVLEV